MVGAYVNLKQQGFFKIFIRISEIEGLYKWKVKLQCINLDFFFHNQNFVC